ncbi:MAG: hypothetical protein HY799_03370 [Nitrosomonadales bacterium]|nr:hypothetical protein [Nitrosomonadales bacterium]
MTIKTYFKIVLVCQFLLGILLIVNSINALPSIRLIAKEPADFSIIIEALHSVSPTTQQTQRAAEILLMQRDSLVSLSDSAEIASNGVEYIGVFMVLSGIAMAFGYLKFFGRKKIAPE